MELLPDGGGGFGAAGPSGGAAGIGCGGFLGSPGLTTATEIGCQWWSWSILLGFGAASVPGGGGGGGGLGGGGGGGSARCLGCARQQQRWWRWRSRWVLHLQVHLHLL
ncbi:MAG: hypothetical protein IPO02_10710 [Bacteroidetes bacterium]|nr:hypothetical protein [Bacteroidota bacterium]